jgi:hypothetical protein
LTGLLEGVNHLLCHRAIVAGCEAL